MPRRHDHLFDRIASFQALHTAARRAIKGKRRKVSAGAAPQEQCDRFIVGEVTRTDVAQAESSLATGRSDYFTAEGNLKTSVADFRRVIGIEPTRLEPARTIESLLPRTLGSAVDLGLAEHPGVQAALHAVDAAALQVKLAEGQLYPSLNLVGDVQQLPFRFTQTRDARALYGKRRTVGHHLSTKMIFLLHCEALVALRDAGFRLRDDRGTCH